MMIDKLTFLVLFILALSLAGCGGEAASTPEVAEVVLYFMILRFDQGDILKRSVKKAYFTNKGVISV